VEFEENSSLLMMKAENMLSSAWAAVQGLLGGFNFSPEEALANTPNIDPHFIAKAPMNNDNLDVHVLNQLGSIGLKRGKEITAQSHPELYHAWAVMSARAGLKQVPQLILAESKTINALTVSPQEVVVTTGLLKTLNLREVRAVLGHELGHASSDHTTPCVMANIGLTGGGVLAGSYLSRTGVPPAVADALAAKPTLGQRIEKSLFGRVSQPASFAKEVVYGAALGYVGSIAAHHVAYRPTEYDADRKGAQISGDPEGLIMALTKLQDSHKSGPLMRLFHDATASHPPIPHRISRLREMEKTMPPVAAQETLDQPEPVNTMVTQADAPTAQITHVTQALRVGTPVAPSLANG
jgi:heat shock protein HtpX